MRTASCKLETPEMLKNWDFQGITLGVLRVADKSVRMTILHKYDLLK